MVRSGTYEHIEDCNGWSIYKVVNCYGRSFYTAAKCGYNPFLYAENDEATFEAIVNWCERH